MNYCLSDRLCIDVAMLFADRRTAFVAPDCNAWMKPRVDFNGFVNQPEHFVSRENDLTIAMVSNELVFSFEEDKGAMACEETPLEFALACRDA